MRKILSQITGAAAMVVAASAGYAYAQGAGPGAGGPGASAPSNASNTGWNADGTRAARADRH